MFAFLFGSYSILQVIPVDSVVLLNSICLYFLLCPPPLWRTVILPSLFRPFEFINPFNFVFIKGFFFKLVFFY